MSDFFVPTRGNPSSSPDQDFYEILVEGALDDSWSDWLGGLQISSLADGQTLISGWLPDQAALHGLLARIRDMNLKLVSVKRKGGKETMNEALLEVRDLETEFHTSDGIVHAVNGVSFDLKEGETLAVVGESGCGKSVTMLSMLRLIPSPPGKVVGGSARYYGQDLLQMRKSEIRRLRGSEIAMIFQDPMTSLNPTLTIGRQLTEPLEEHLGMQPAEARERAAGLLELTGIPRGAERLKDYPHNFSGGMRQRVMIAMALACSPKILIADEPTTALDVTIQAQIVELVERLRDEMKMAIIWITHDLGIVAGLADRVMVMYGGFVIEEALVDELYANPQHPYTLGLLGSLPRLDEREHQRLASIKGLPPVLYNKPVACPFASRCSLVMQRCLKANPELKEVAPGHRVACWGNPLAGRIN